MAAIPLMLTGAMPQAFSSLAGSQQAQPTAAPAAAPAPASAPAPATPAPTMTPASMTSTTQGSNPFFQNPPLAGGANVASVNNPNSNFLLALLQQLFHGGNAFGALGANTMGQGAAPAAAAQAPTPSALGIGGGGAATFAPGSGNALGALPPPSTFAGASNPFTQAAAAPVQSAVQQNISGQQAALAQQAAQVQAQIQQASELAAHYTPPPPAYDPVSGYFSAASQGG